MPPDLRARQDVAAVAPDEEAVAGVAERRLRVDVHRGDVVAVHLAGEPRSADDGDRLPPVRQADAPREEEVGHPPEAAAARPDVEHPGVFEEEVALLRKEEREAGQVDLLLVHLHLREVGVQGQVEVEARRYAVLDVQAVVVEPRAVEAALDAILPPAGQRVGRQPQIHAAVDRADAVHRAGEADAGQRVLLRDRRPEYLLVLAADVPHEVDAPDLLLGPGKAERHHRDGDFGHPAVVGATRDDVPHAVPVDVDVVAVAPAPAAFALLGHLLLQLRAERAGDEHVARAAVVEGVENDLEVVLVEQPQGIAPHLGGDDAVRFRVVGLHADVEGLGVVEQPHHGLLGSRFALGGLLLDEIVDDRGLQPDLLVEAPVDLRAGLDADRGNAVVLARRKDGRIRRSRRCLHPG